MKNIFSAIWQAASTLLGVLVFAALMWWIARAHSRMWRSVSAGYPRRSGSRVIAKKSLDTIVITRRGASGPIVTGNVEYRQYPGVLLAVHDKYLSISLWPPFNVLCPTIELPFDEMELRQTYWALWPEPFALRMRRRKDVDIILGSDTVQWLRSHTDSSPFGLEGA